MSDNLPPELPRNMTMIDKLIRFCLDNKLVMALLVLMFVGWGVMVAPFDWKLGGLPRKPVPTDAIPDIGENQQVVFTPWVGRSPQDVQDQITYPLTVSLLGIPGVKTIRSNSVLGFSMIYIIFEEKVDFYWSRSRILEKLSSLPSGTLPQGVKPMLGPDATALGQIYWYTLEGRDPDDNPIGGWDLQELRSIQDWDVRYAILAAEGISEVGSVGGFVKEYQIDVDPDAMRAHGITLDQVFMAVKMSNVDVGARTIEVNNVEYIIRGLGFIKDVSDIENSVIKVSENVPIYIKNIAKVSLGPGLRRGAMDKGGAEAVGAVVVVRYGYNPLKAIENVKKKIDEIAPSLPTKVVFDKSKISHAGMEQFAQDQGFEAFHDGKPNQKEWLEWFRSAPSESRPKWVTTSQVTIVRFYDRTGLIRETLGTLSDALFAEILVTIIVVIVAVMHLRSSILIGGALPLAVLICFVAMKTFGVDANIVALSGIAIAIGTIVDMGIIVCENILKHLDAAPPDADRMEVIFEATREVGGAVLTAVTTTVVGFLPVFIMTGALGKLFKPLAFTKTFALIASAVVALTIIPPGAYLLFGIKRRSSKIVKWLLSAGLVAGGAVVAFMLAWWAGAIMIVLGAYYLAKGLLPSGFQKIGTWLTSGAVVLFVGVLLTQLWMPLGPARGMLRNLVFVTFLIAGFLIFFQMFQRVYGPILRWFLAHKLVFLVMPIALVVAGIAIMITRPKEFMPPLDEGSFLYMPTTMTHASIGESMDAMRKQDMAFNVIPEVDVVVGKIGRADTPLDPAPVSMVETFISYKPEYVTDKDGRRVKYKYDKKRQEFERDGGRLIPDPKGRPYRQWRDHIKTPDDIWEEILKAGKIPGSTSAPKLQPIKTRMVMLQSGMRAPMGIKVKGPDSETIEKVCLEIERLLKESSKEEVPGLKREAVIADRIVGKPYLEIDIDREASAKEGINIRNVQNVIEVAVGGKRITTTVEGRERYPVRVRYMRELRDQIETLGRILVPARDGAQIPLSQLAEINYVRGPQVIKSEDTFLQGYVLFDASTGYAEVDVVEACKRYLLDKEESGEFKRPRGVSYDFAGNYKNQIRSQKTLMLVVPISLFIIFIVLYMQFKSVFTTLIVFCGIAVAAGGGFILMWLYGQPWFMRFSVFGTEMRELFQIHPINLSVAVWVGFLALFGIASDNGVVLATYLDQSFGKCRPATIEETREATIVGAVRRIRPCLMTSATTILALVPVLTSRGRGSDVMVPMAIPSFGGMLVVLTSVFFVPVVYCLIKELQLPSVPDIVPTAMAEENRS